MSIEAEAPSSEPVPAKSRLGWEIAAAIALFVAFCAIVLSKAPILLEPDDYAYQASIAALAHGNVTLTADQYDQLASELKSASPVTDGPGAIFGNSGIAQWVQLKNGNWISEKNPGYPFLALPFYLIGNVRLAPLFYGGLACLALFGAARRWLGPWSGTAAVALFLGSGAAMVFAWRANMPTFTDASLLAAGTAALIYTFLAHERGNTIRTIIGLAGFIAIEAAVAARYTNIVVLAVACLATLFAFRPTGLTWRSLALWFGSVVVLGAMILGFNQHYYGNAIKTGYNDGVITFSVGSIIPNLQSLPSKLIAAMPMIVLALIAVVWLVVRWLATRRETVVPEKRARANRDLAVGGPLMLAWLGMWGLYSAYDWTVMAGHLGPMGGGGDGISAELSGSVHLIRFYIPALGMIAFLATWFVMQLPKWIPAIVVALLLAVSVPTFNALATDQMGGPGGFPGGPGGFPGGPGGPGGFPGGPGMPGFPDGGPPGGYPEMQPAST